MMSLSFPSAAGFSIGPVGPSSASHPPRGPLAHQDFAARPLNRLALSTTVAKNQCRFFRGYRPVDCAGESHAEVDADAVVDDLVHGHCVCGEIEVREEAEGSKGKGKNRRNDPLAAGC